MPKEKIKSVIDFFYTPFSKIMPLQTFRYAACGGGNMLLGFFTYIFVYHVFAHKQDVGFGVYTFKPYSFALFVSGCQTFFIGFLLNKFVVFVESNLRGRIQLFRYFLSFVFNFCLNYILLKAFIEYFHMNPVAAQMFVTIIIIAISYLTQRHFTFRTKAVR